MASNGVSRTLQIQVRSEPGEGDACERCGNGAGRDRPDGVLEPGDLDRVVLAEALELIRAVRGPECGETAAGNRRVQVVELREDRGHWVWLVEVACLRPVVQEREAEREVGGLRVHERLEQDVHDNVRVVQVGVELIPEARMRANRERKWRSLAASGWRGSQGSHIPDAVFT
jgi:hypothetical protein